MCLLGDNYDKMKAVKFLPLFSALQMVPPLSKLEMRFHVAVTARVPVSLSLSSLPLLPSVSLPPIFPCLSCLFFLSLAVPLTVLPFHCQFFILFYFFVELVIFNFVIFSELPINQSLSVPEAAVP